MRLRRWLIIRSSLNCSSYSRLLEKAHICSLIKDKTSVRSPTPKHSKTFSMKVITKVLLIAVFSWLANTTLSTSFSYDIPEAGKPRVPFSEDIGDNTFMRTLLKMRSMWVASLGLSASWGLMARRSSRNRWLLRGLTATTAYRSAKFVIFYEERGRAGSPIDI